MLYELFMFLFAGSIIGVAVCIVLFGLLCVWCAFIGRKRAERSSPARIDQVS
jgi:spore maturation protein SpmA